MADVGSAECTFRESSDGEHAPSLGDALDERQPRRDLGGGRAPVRGGDPRPVRMRRHEIPEQHVVGDPELGQRSVDDRRAELGGAGACELPFGGEREARDSGPVVARSFTDEHERGGAPLLEVATQPLATERRPGVLVERRPDPRSRDVLHEVYARIIPERCLPGPRLGTWSQAAASRAMFSGGAQALSLAVAAARWPKRTTQPDTSSRVSGPGPETRPRETRRARVRAVRIPPWP